MISEGESIHKAITFAYGEILGNSTGPFPIVDKARFFKWRTNGATILAFTLHSHRLHNETLVAFSRLQDSKSDLEWGIAFIRGIKDDFERDLLGDPRIAIEAEIAADYMSQAEELIGENPNGQYNYVPAAVLSGAVLEKALRTMCSQQTPAVEILKPNGDPKKMNLLIDDLQKAGTISATKAKQVRVWAAIRNGAAHWELDKFTRSEVEEMIVGINNFLAEYLH